MTETAQTGVVLGMVLLGALGCGSSPESSGPRGGGGTVSGGSPTSGGDSSQTGGRNSSQTGGAGGSSPSGGSFASAGAGGTGSGGSAPSTTCGNDEALCNGHCFADVGEEHDGCRLLVQPVRTAGNYNGAYLPAAVDGKLYFLMSGQLDVVDLASLERRPVYGDSMAIDYGVADTFAIVSDLSRVLRVELADGKATTLVDGMAGTGFTLRDATWYFSSNLQLSTMPREGGTVTATGIPAGTFAIVGDDVYSETGSLLSAEVWLSNLSNATSSVQLAELDDSAKLVQANEHAAYWLGDGKYHKYSVAEQTVTAVSWGARYPRFATHDSLVRVERDDQQQLAKVSISDLELNGEQVLATIAPGPQSEIVTATDTHLYVCTDHGGIFEVAR